jgi:hypothetical protein
MLGMMSSENRSTLFGIMPDSRGQIGQTKAERKGRP